MKKLIAIFAVVLFGASLMGATYEKINDKVFTETKDKVQDHNIDFLHKRKERKQAELDEIDVLIVEAGKLGITKTS